MNRIYTTVSVVALTTLAAPAAMAASLLIDDFKGVDQEVTVASTATGAKEGSTILDGNVLGGSRGLALITDPAGTDEDSANDLGDSTLAVDTRPSSGDGILTFDNDSQQTSTGVIVYSGAGASTSEPDLVDIDPSDNIFDFTIDTDPTDGFDPILADDFGISTFALGGFDTSTNPDTPLGVDLTQNGTLDRFFFEILDNDLNINIGIYAYDTSGGIIGSFGEDLMDPVSPFAFFTQFTDDEGNSLSGVDFVDVGALAFAVQNDFKSPVDGILGSISIVPLPAPALFLLGGLGSFLGISAAAKRRRRKA